MRGISGLLLTSAGPIALEERLRAMSGGAVRFVDGPVAIAAEESLHAAASADGLVTVAHDGASFAERELCDELDAGDASGAELLLRGYEAWGAAGLAERLDGAHAFAIWDGRRRMAFLARDRFGVRPLFVLRRAPGLAFASSLRAVARSGLWLPKLDEEALWGMLSRGVARGERTLLAGVERLPVGCVLEWSGETGAVDIVRYYEVPCEYGPVAVELEEAAERARSLLESSARRRLEGASRVAVGASGGPAAGAIAEMLAAQRIAVDGAALVEAAERLLTEADEPVSGEAIGAAAVFAAAAREGIVVASAVGGDELFAAAARHRAFATAQLASGHERVERAARDAELRRAMRERFGVAVPLPEPDAVTPFAGYPLAAPDELVLSLLAPDRRPPLDAFREALEAIEGDLLEESGRLRTPVQRALYLDLRLGLERRVAARAEAARIFGAVWQAPYLDPDLVEEVVGLPDCIKLGESGEPRLLEAIASSAAPTETVDALALALAGGLLERARGELRESALVREGIVSRRGVDALFFAHEELGLDVGRVIWTLLSVDRWWREVSAAPHPVATAIGSDGGASEGRVEIVIPVYESLNLVRDCVRSIRNFTDSPYRVILVDDASRPAAHERLREIVGDDPRFEVVRNEKNLGFLRTCLRGISLTTADYVVLLNSDTVVTPGWLERMVACAESDPRIAVVNPLSNEAVNLSVRFAPGLNLVSMARRIAELSERRYPDVTTAVGMCMLVRRSALDLLGGFDEAFAPAYCEESDLCMRFTEAGLRVVAADDAFVYHKGSASYGDEAKSRHYERNREEFDRRWSVAYARDLAAYSRRDPLQYVRDALLRDTVRVEDSHPDRYLAVETRLARLEPGEALAATADGARPYAAAALLPLRAPVRGRDAALEARVGRYDRPVSAFGSRHLVFPTRRYVSRLPEAEPGALRVTFLVSSLPLAGGVISILHVARELMLAGHDVKVVTEAHEIAPEVLNLWTQPLVYRDREHLFEAFPESDVVLATWWVTSHRYMRELRRRYDFVAGYYVQDYEALFYPEHDVEARQDAVLSYRWADHHVYASQWIADHVGPEAAAKSVVIPLDVDLDIFYPRANRTGGRPRVVSVAAPGVETRRRGFPETVEAFRLIHEARPDVELVFFGADASRMPDLPFPYTNMGRLYDQNRVAELVSSADVLVDASLWQGFGRPGLEAMACGTVPVLTGVGGLFEYARDGENCLLTPSGDAAAVAASTLRLLEDRELYGRLASEGIRTAQGFSHKLIAARHLETYRRWVRERKAGE